jgi:phosphate transport system substrate-binding protein
MESGGGRIRWNVWGSVLGGLIATLSWLPMSIALAQLKPALDPELEPYQHAGAVSGQLRISGSETMKGILHHWETAFLDLYSGVRVSIQTAGSATAVPELLSGATQVAAMSREMTKAEHDAFTKQFGYPPFKVMVGVDALAIYVHRDNPIAGLTLAEVDAIFSKSRKRGYPHSIDRWGSLGLKAPWAEAPIRLHGRDPFSGTGSFLAEHVLGGGEFKDKVREQPGSATIVVEIMKDLYAMGYSGIGYRTLGVRPVPLAVKQGDPFVAPSFQTAMSGAYPLHRFLYLYVNNPPKGGIPRVVMEFLKFVSSKEGQSTVQKEGFFPLSADRLKDQVAALTAPFKEASSGGAEVRR